MDISIRQGETLYMAFTADDLSAETLNLIAKDTEGTAVLNETVNFTTVDGERVAEINTNDTDIEPGKYEYMLTITYTDSHIDKLPDASSCGDTCSFPILTICESLDAEVS